MGCIFLKLPKYFSKQNYVFCGAVNKKGRLFVHRLLCGRWVASLLLEIGQRYQEWLQSAGLLY